MIPLRLAATLWAIAFGQGTVATQLITVEALLQTGSNAPYELIEGVLEGGDVLPGFTLEVRTIFRD